MGKCLRQLLPIFRLLALVTPARVREGVGMRAIFVSGGVLAVAAVFGLGVVVGRFVLNRDVPVVSAPSNAIMGPSGLDNPLGDPNAAVAGDPTLNTLPPAAAAPLPPAIPPTANGAGSPTPAAPIAITARNESDAAIAASAVTAACSVRVSNEAPIRSWTKMDRVTANAVGDTCGTATVRIVLETPEGTALYSLQAPARDFGIGVDASPEEVRNRITQLLPTNAIRAAAYPEWQAGKASPTRNEFTQQAYEAVRAANVPVTCVKLPTASQRCVAADPSSGQLRVFSRGE
jgi:hypothetical protein